MNTPEEINRVLAALKEVNNKIKVDGVVGPVCVKTFAELASDVLPACGNRAQEELNNAVIMALIIAGCDTPEGCDPLVTNGDFGISSIAAAFYFVANNFQHE